MSSFIIVDRDEDNMRSRMRTNMRRGTNHESISGREYEAGYRVGYRHGWDDNEDEKDGYRHDRDSRGRYM